MRTPSTQSTGPVPVSCSCVSCSCSLSPDLSGEELDLSRLEKQAIHTTNNSTQATVPMEKLIQKVEESGPHIITIIANEHPVPHIDPISINIHSPNVFAAMYCLAESRSNCLLQFMITPRRSLYLYTSSACRCICQKRDSDRTQNARGPRDLADVERNIFRTRIVFQTHKVRVLRRAPDFTPVNTAPPN